MAAAQDGGVRQTGGGSSAVGQGGGDGALSAMIAQNVKKPSLTVNVINFDFFGFNVSIWVSWSPLGPKKYDTLVESFRFTRYLERNKVYYTQF